MAGEPTSIAREAIRSLVSGITLPESKEVQEVAKAMQVASQEDNEEAELNVLSKELVNTSVGSVGIEAIASEYKAHRYEIKLALSGSDLGIDCLESVKGTVSASGPRRKKVAKLTMVMTTGSSFDMQLDVRSLEMLLSVLRDAEREPNLAMATVKRENNSGDCAS